MRTNLSHVRPLDKLELRCRLPGTDDTTAMHNGELEVYFVDERWVHAMTDDGRLYVFRRSTGREARSLFCARPR